VTKPLYFTQDKINFIIYLEHRREIIKMFFRSLRLPPRVCYKPPDKLFLAADKIYHSALIMANKRNAPDITDGNCIRNFEFTVAQVCSARADDECKIIRDTQMLSVIHAHADKQLGAGEGFIRTGKVVVFEQMPDRSTSVPKWNIGF
jgi:hypothetical protein